MVILLLLTLFLCFHDNSETTLPLTINKINYSSLSLIVRQTATDHPKLESNERRPRNWMPSTTTHYFLH